MRHVHHLNVARRELHRGLDGGDPRSRRISRRLSNRGGRAPELEHRADDDDAEHNHDGHEHNTDDPHGCSGLGRVVVIVGHER